MKACAAPWPGYDESKTLDAEKEIAIQINGKLRSTIVVPADSEDGFVVDSALKNEKITRLLDGMEVVKTIVIKNRLVNLIVKPSK